MKWNETHKDCTKHPWYPDYIGSHSQFHLGLLEAYALFTEKMANVLDSSTESEIFGNTVSCLESSVPTTLNIPFAVYLKELPYHIFL